MLYAMVFAALLGCLSPLGVTEFRRDYELRIENMTGHTVVGWEKRVHGVAGWRQLRLRIEPGEEIRVVLGFTVGPPPSGAVEQIYVRESGKSLGALALLHLRTFNYPAFIIDELYARGRWPLLPAKMGRFWSGSDKKGLTSCVRVCAGSPTSGIFSDSAQEIQVC